MPTIGLNQNLPIKYIDIQVGTYLDNNRIRFGLQPPRSLVDNLMGSIYGRVSAMNFETAQRMADEISNRFAIPVTLIRENRVGLNRNVNNHEIDLPEALEIRDLSRFREMIQHLNEHGYMTTDDRAELIPHITEVERTLADAARLQNLATVAQTEMLRFVAEPYIDALINAVRDAPSNASMQGRSTEWLNVMPETTSRREIAQAILLDTMQLHPGTLFLEQMAGIEEIDSGNALKDLYNGRSTMESTFRRNGVSMPNLPAQRAILHDLIIQKLTETFGEETNPPIPGHSKEFLQALRRVYFIEGIPLGAVKCHGNTLVIDSFRAIGNGLLGDFGMTHQGNFYPHDYWGDLREETQYQQKFAQMRRTAENELRASIT